MTIARTCFAAVLVSLLTAVGSQAQAHTYADIDTMALRLQTQSAALHGEFRAHYSHATHYRHLINDSAQMYRLAAHIHELAHVGHGLDHIASDLAQLDRLFHHIQALVDHIEHDALHGIGHIHGRTGHVKRLMAGMELTLHELRRQVSATRLALHRPHVGHGHLGHGGHVHGGHGHLAGRGRNSVHWRSSGVSFGPGGIRIRF